MTRSEGEKEQKENTQPIESGSPETGDSGNPERQKLAVDGRNGGGNRAPELVVVGIGSSAGGLEAIQSFVSNLPPDTGFSFLVAQHLSPSYRSMMVSLLEKNSTIPINVATNGDTLKPNELYICPPNHNIELGPNDTIKLISYPELSHRPRPSVDMLFESIATRKGDVGVGVILSGTGSDGSRGIRAIKAENGIGVVQAPESAKFDGMPNAAIDSGNIDLVIPPDHIGRELVNLLSFPRFSREQKETISRTVYNGIIHQLHAHCDVDFQHYKENTVIRRIERRMATLKIDSPADYLSHMQDHREEASFLFNDMLIGVTSFFRDARAFEALRSELEKYIKEKDTKTLRFWSVGCSTGEEAYSLAMIISDILGDSIDDWKIQVFATDIDKRAINYARNGIYPEIAIENLPSSMRKKYLTISNDQYEVVKSIKSKLIFSLHDINKDPPFLRLDMICCRNLLIYFSMELQRQIFPTFHYALNSRGLLMLGQSESVGSFQEHFKPLSQTGKVYESVYVGKKELPPDRQLRGYIHNRSTSHHNDMQPRIMDSSPKVNVRPEEAYKELIANKLKDILLPNSIIINDNQDIIFTEGANPILIRPEGKPSNNIFKNLHPRLSVDLRSALHELDGDAMVSDTGYINIELGNTSYWVKLIMAKAILAKPTGTLTVIYTQTERAEKLPLYHDQNTDTAEVLVQEQKRLLTRTKEQLQNVIEELEASNEEMQSMNEELQSSNEELQSANEELETTNEELQSTNEELETAYSELKAAYQDKEQQQKALVRLRSELEQANTLKQEAERIGRTGSLMWDVTTRRMTWSHGCCRIFGLDEKVFQPSYEALIGITHPDDRNALEQHFQDLLENRGQQPFIFKIQDTEHNTIVVSMEALVSFNDLKQPVKVMASVSDITENLKYRQEAKLARERLNIALESSFVASFIYDVDIDGIFTANERLLDLAGMRKEQLEEYTSEELIKKIAEPDQQKVNDAFNELMNSPPGKVITIDYRIVNKDKKMIPVRANSAVLQCDEQGKVEKIIVHLTVIEP